MLLELKINNFAIIKSLEVSFKSGLNIITGETGTGKSILIEALGVLLGSRTSKEYIRTGESMASLEGVFYLENDKVYNKLREQDLNLAEDRVLIIDRTISLNGPSLTKVNGKNVNLAMLNDITRHLVDIFGQHEHQSLLDVYNHKRLLDSFGDEKLLSLKEATKDLYQVLMEKRKELASISSDNMQKDREIDILRYQISEIEEGNIDVKKDNDIEEEYRKYSKLGEINTMFCSIINNYDDLDLTGSSLLEKLSRDVINLEKIQALDENIDKIYSRLKNLEFEFQDIIRDSKDYIEGLNFDSAYIEALETRLDIINRLKSKYGEDLESVLSFKLDAEEKLKVLENQDVEISRLETEIRKLEKELLELGEDLTRSRKNLAKVLEEKIQNELEYLNMKNIIFKVDFKTLDDFSLDGLDKIEFLISTNMGEGLKSLSKIASGGEMSRIMLAFKSILAKYDTIETMIFDEIDTGISGKAAYLVGEKIYEISKLNQVICISHLPQITSMADYHYSINKEIIGNKTGSYIKELNYDERVNELARLIGGLEVTDTTIKNAVEIIETSKKMKEKK